MRRRTLARALLARYEYTRRSTDDFLFPRSGTVAALRLGASVPGVSTEDFRPRVGQLAWFHAFSRNDDFTMRGELGAVLARSSQGIPQALLFRTGGDTTVRGYAFESIGVQKGGAIVGGRYYALASTEYTHWFGDTLGYGHFYRCRQRGGPAGRIQVGDRLRHRRPRENPDRAAPARRGPRARNARDPRPLLGRAGVLMRRGLRRFSLVAGLLFAALLAGAWWVASSPTALQWIVTKAVQRSNGTLVVEGVSGSLFGRMLVHRLTYSATDVRITLEDVALEMSRDAWLHGKLEVIAEAAMADIHTIPSGTPTSPPDSLALPFDIEIKRGRIAQARIEDQSFNNLAFDYRGGSASHALHALSADTDWGRLTGELRIAATRPFALSGQFRLERDERMERAACVGRRLAGHRCCSARHGARRSCRREGANRSVRPALATRGGRARRKTLTRQRSCPVPLNRQSGSMLPAPLMGMAGQQAR